MTPILKSTTEGGVVKIKTKGGLPSCECCSSSSSSSSSSDFSSSSSSSSSFDSFFGLGGQIQYLVNLMDLVETKDIDSKE